MDAPTEEKILFNADQTKVWPKQGHPDANQQYCSQTLMMYGIIKRVAY
jgi:hypothetical protein